MLCAVPFSALKAVVARAVGLDRQPWMGPVTTEPNPAIPSLSRPEERGTRTGKRNLMKYAPFSTSRYSRMSIGSACTLDIQRYRPTYYFLVRARSGRTRSCNSCISYLTIPPNEIVGFPECGCSVSHSSAATFAAESKDSRRAVRASAVSSASSDSFRTDVRISLPQKESSTASVAAAALRDFGVESAFRNASRNSRRGNSRSVQIPGQARQPLLDQPSPPISAQQAFLRRDSRVEEEKTRC